MLCFPAPPPQSVRDLVGDSQDVRNYLRYNDWCASIGVRPASFGFLFEQRMAELAELEAPATQQDEEEVEEPLSSLDDPDQEEVL